jgi:hypothetical protein
LPPPINDHPFSQHEQQRFDDRDWSSGSRQVELSRLTVAAIELAAEPSPIIGASRYGANSWSGVHTVAPPMPSSTSRPIALLANARSPSRSSTATNSGQPTQSVGQDRRMGNPGGLVVPVGYPALGFQKGGQCSSCATPEAAAILLSR